MIVRSKPTIKDVLFTLRGSILPGISLRLLMIALVTLFAIVLAQGRPHAFARISAIPFTLIGIALSVFMSFRNSACYDRWWEGRRLWGDMIIACRSFAREVSTLDADNQRFLLLGLCGFASGLAARLRGENELAAIEPWRQPGGEARAPHPTDALLRQIGNRCLALVEDGRIGEVRYSVLERQLCELSRVQGGCERIASTPVPFAYSLLLHRTAIAFCLTLPFALVGSLDWWTFLPVLLVAYTFFGLDALGNQLEDPFAQGLNALPLDAMKRTIERDMLASLGREDLPPPVLPVRHVLR